MNILRALRFDPDDYAAIVGAGGKTTLLFQLARQLPPPVVVAATTHLGRYQLGYADRHIQITSELTDENLRQSIGRGVTLFTGPLSADDHEMGLTMDQMERIRVAASEKHLPIIIEADGSRTLPLKAPGAHEPPIPDWVTKVIVIVGMNGIGKSLSGEFVHRPEIFSRISGVAPGEPITIDAVIRVLSHPEGGLKNIPGNAKKFVLFNQADTPERQEEIENSAGKLLKIYDAVISASLNPGGQIRRPEEAPACVHAVYEPNAAIILAAGASSRMETPKQVLDYQGEPFVRAIARKAVQAGYSPVILVSGAHREEVEAAVSGLSIQMIYNPSWTEGQSTSIKAGLAAVPKRCGAAVFLLADQPQVSISILHTLYKRHSHNLAPITAPFINGKRANPVLFDRMTFQAFDLLKADEGGRMLFPQFEMDSLDWADETLLYDVDTPADYERLKGGGK